MNTLTRSVVDFRCDRGLLTRGPKWVTAGGVLYRLARLMVRVRKIGKHTLAAHLWGEKPGAVATLRTLISRLNQRLKQIGSTTRLIHSEGTVVLVPRFASVEGGAS